MAGSGWTAEETRSLISVWGQANVQSQLDGVTRNRVVYEQIARDLEDLGYDRTWEQCRTKIKNLTQRYRKVRDANRVSGNSASTCPFYEEIDAILGTRAASTPAVLLESSADDGSIVVPSQADLQTDGEADTETGSAIATSGSDSLPSVDASPTAASTTTSGSSNSGGATVAATSSSTATAPSSTATTPSSRTTTASGNNGTTSSNSSGQSSRTLVGRLGAKRKMDSSEVMACLAKMEERAEERAYKWEEKRMRIEAEMEEKRRESERRHEERMQGMVMNIFQQMMMMGGGWAPAPFPPMPIPSPDQPEDPNQPSNNNSAGDPPTTSGE